MSRKDKAMLTRTLNRNRQMMHMQTPSAMLLIASNAECRKKEKVITYQSSISRALLVWCARESIV